MAVRTQPTLSLGMLARIAEAVALSPSSFCKRYRSSYETPSPSSSPTLPIWKRYRGTSELVEDTKDESSDLDTKREDEPLSLGYRALRRHELALGEGSVPSTFEIGQSSRSMSEQQRVEETPTPRPRVHATWVDPVDGKVYTDIPVDVPPVRVPVQTPPSVEWSSGSLPVLPSSLVVLTLVASPVTTPAATIAVGEDEFFEVGAQLELHGSILHDHTSREVSDEIFSQRYRLRSLEQEHERATVTFDAIWRPVLALES
ncbi:hypothetical protein Tco_0000921 [Tanacetum coccineum]